MQKIDPLPASVLASAPAPETVSSAAQQALRRVTNLLVPEDLESNRRICAEVQRELGATQLERHGVQMEETALAGIPVRIFKPADLSATNRQRILLNLHGGSFTVDAGSITENVTVAAHSRTTVVAALYRLAPEHRFPAAVDDAYAVYSALLAEYPAERIGLYGTSAGACLCAQLLVRLSRTGRPFPGALGFFTGTADLTRSGDSEYFFRPISDSTSGADQFSEYLGDCDRYDPQVSPVFSDLSRFPTTLCIAGTRDFMLSQTALFHQALLRSGVDASLVVFEGMPHAHWIFLDLPESDQAFKAMADFFTRRLPDGTRRPSE